MNFIESQKAKLLKEKYAGIESTEFIRDGQRLENGEPYEYVLGYVDFLGCRIDLGYRPMIPRYETAFWVERAISKLAQKNHALRIADTFAGSGNVGLAVLAHIKNSYVEFSEYDESLLEQIHINCVLNDIEPSRYSISRGDGLSALSGTYDAIFAVPPYVAKDALPELDPEMIHYEPHLAFFAEEDGTAFHRMLVREAYDFVAHGGTLYMEADMDQDKIIRNFLNESRWKSIECWEDPYGATPNIVLQK